MRQNLRERYADTVELEYIDLAVPAVRERRPDLAARAGALQPLPVVLIGDIAALAGSIEYRSLVEAIETAREVNSGQGL